MRFNLKNCDKPFNITKTKHINVFPFQLYFASGIIADTNSIQSKNVRPGSIERIQRRMKSTRSPVAYNHGLPGVLYGQSMVMEMIGNEIYVNLILEDLPRPYWKSGVRG